MPAVQITVNVMGVLGVLSNVGSPAFMSPFLKTATGRAALTLQGMMRADLDAMVYSQPPSPYYQRTGTLMRSTHAAKLETDHSGDEGRAYGGADLQAKQPEDVVSTRLDSYQSEIGSWIHYALYVHEGMGRGWRIPKPFTGLAAARADDLLRGELRLAGIRMARAAGRL